MNNNRQKENELREQEAPLKNTDKAFVKVNKNGQPEMPVTKEEGKGAPPNISSDPQKMPNEQ